MKNRKYLNIIWSALLIRYAAIYIPLALVISFSQRWSVFPPFTIYFWMTCGLLILLEKFGSYTEFDQEQVVQRYFFLKSRIPISNIQAIKKGYAQGIIGQPKSIEMQFVRKDGTRGVRHILLHQFKAEKYPDK